jgi:hypothetical protein
MPHANKGLGGSAASPSHLAGATKNTKHGGGKGVSTKKRPKS